MVRGKIIYVTNPKEFGDKISNLFIDTIVKCLSAKNQCFIAISGGSTPVPVFKALVKKYEQKTLKWSNVHVYSIDERCVPGDHPDNNFNSCYDIWLKYFPEINTHRIESWRRPSDAVKIYENEINSLLYKKNGLPQFDLIFMGIGDDGHIASLFPEYDFGSKKTSYVEDLNIKSKGVQRITMTLPVLNNAKNRIIGVVGEKKKKIFADLLNSDYNNYPVAKLLSSNANDIWVVV